MHIELDYNRTCALHKPLQNNIAWLIIIFGMLAGARCSSPESKRDSSYNVKNAIWPPSHMNMRTPSLKVRTVSSCSRVTKILCPMGLIMYMNLDVTNGIRIKYFAFTMPIYFYFLV